MNRFKELRKTKGRTQQQIAALLSISQAAYSKYECEKAEPDLTSLNILSEYYGVSVDYLLGRTDTAVAPYPAGSIEEMKVELKRLGIDRNDREQLALWEKIQGLTPEQKQLIVAMINNFKD